MKLKYVSLDLETSGLNPRTDQILELAAVIETNWVTPVAELPTLHLLVLPEDGRIEGNVQALVMNAGLLAEFTKPASLRMAPTAFPEEAWNRLRDFLTVNLVLPCTVAGKNVASFDLLFLE